MSWPTKPVMVRENTLIISGTIGAPAIMAGRSIPLYVGYSVLMSSSCMMFSALFWNIRHPKTAVSGCPKMASLAGLAELHFATLRKQVTGKGGCCADKDDAETGAEDVRPVLFVGNDLKALPNQ